ncbi:hypothetical protein LWI28_019033 [Acer negundo]|uniref:Uncharacterized protein n=1 Tax=Acer negundo TaxID=4023 RepID=A0AAD5I6N7_ACENE|nr:hypothetical protein LWI28_019033 [Acer negundo]
MTSLLSATMPRISRNKAIGALIINEKSLTSFCGGVLVGDLFSGKVGGGGWKTNGSAVGGLPLIYSHQRYTFSSSSRSNARSTHFRGC